MSKSKRAQLRRERQHAAEKNRNIAIGLLILIVVAVAVWQYISSTQAAAAVAATATAEAQAFETQKAANAGACVPTSRQYASAPEMTIDKTKQYFATFKMDKGGTFVVQLYPDKAPITVNSFVFLAREGYFDCVTFHRVLEGFMAQGGDPTGTGGGGPGYEFVNEVSDLQFDKAGVVAMANAGRDTNGSQFFIMFGPYGLSPNDYTIFGQVVEGMEVVNSITRRDPQQFPDYSGDVIESITITEK
jgi:cyclophilin family peptidyl-prolyl cis-trans isomerase